ncbi:MAG TPA: hypothetical protein VMX74_03685 [Pirellulales bacterium]|nr:hypothetical protein [Pirellulales bacterium]
MPELRHDPLTDRWVIIAENRSDRPQGFSRVQTAAPMTTCPFCAGHEEQTPHELLAFGRHSSDSDQPGWQVRVVPNKYPVLERQSSDRSASGDEMFACQPAVGMHEVIIESPRHLTRTTELTTAEFCEVLRAYRHRFQAAREDGSLVYGLAFKNVGPDAGATLEHLHSQFVALPVLPTIMRQELAKIEQHARDGRDCIVCAMMAREVEQQVRVVERSDNFLVFCPYASVCPHETWIAPIEHASDFDRMPDTLTEELSELLLRLLARLDHVADRPAHNYLVNTAPFDSAVTERYHWRVGILPRITTIAGFEWATGCCINPVAPETAADQLRSAGFSTNFTQES